MIDKIHHTSYLLADTIDLSTLKKDTRALFDFQCGAEILSVSVTVEEAGTGTLDLGLKEQTDFFLNNINLATKETSKSSVEATIKADTTLTLETQARTGKIRVRVLYFTPGRMYS